MSQIPLPLIGITAGLTKNKLGSQVCEVAHAYIVAIQIAGGLPLILPIGLGDDALSVLLPRLDGILLTGGGDMDPTYYGGEMHPKVYGICPQRDKLEMALVRKALDAKKPLLAICRGIQVLNVALGGSLYENIEDRVTHALKHDWFPDHPRDKLAHTVSITCGSQLDEITGQDEIQVNSLHHQGIFRVAKGLKATGFAPDGLVEAVEVKNMSFGLGVQWHPECLPDEPCSQALFKAFIEACMKNGE